MTPADDAIIRSAITGRRLVRFSFHGCDRVAEPHDYGVRNGTEQLLVFQVAGESQSGRLPSWRWIALAEAGGFQLLEQTFPGRRPAPSGRHTPWDRLYLRVDEGDSGS